MKAPPLQLIYAGKKAPSGSWHIHSHSHSHFEMIIVTAGHEEVLVDAGKFTVGPGEVLLFKPGQAHEEWSKATDPLVTFFLGFQGSPEQAHWPLRSVDQLGRLQLLSQWLFAERDASLGTARAVQEGFFRSLMLEFQRLLGESEDPLVATTRRFVRENIASQLTVSALAQKAGLSKFHFIRRYKQLCGRRPMEDVRLIRIGHARDLILTSNLPLKAIAPMAGLGDEISLYRLFRRHLGRTPGQLRRSVHKR